MKKKLAGVFAGLLLAIGGWQFGEAAWIHAKAVLAQILIKQAWFETQTGARTVRPWSWADTWPVARLSVPGLGIDQIVLAGATGRTLAFGPAHMDGTAAPGDDGLSVISGHRDTHFRFLQRMKMNDVLILTDDSGQSRRFRVTDTAVVNAEESGLERLPGAPSLALVTCYPFDAVDPGGPLRYLVFAEAVPNVPAAAPSRGRAQRL